MCVCLAHTNSSSILDEERNLQVWEKYTRCEAVCSSSFAPVLTLKGKCLRRRAKPAHLVRHLPRHEQTNPDDREPLETLCHGGGGGESDVSEHPKADDERTGDLAQPIGEAITGCP